MRDYIVNERIRGREVRLIDENGGQLGVVPTPEALKMAREKGLDLVLISPGANPPVCRIADHGKLKYELSKKEKEARKAQKAGGLKEVKLSPKIAQHDFEVRLAKTRECLEKKFKVKVSMFFRGRENMYVDLGMKVMNRLVEAVADLGKVEAPPKKLGKTLFVVISSK